jgi:hypothetical protein
VVLALFRFGQISYVGIHRFAVTLVKSQSVVPSQSVFQCEGFLGDCLEL